MLRLVPLLFLLGPAVAGQEPSPSDLDAFMKRVLARRDVNRAHLKQYVLDETEAFDVFGPGRMRLHGRRREFTWYVRDGMHVRSPLKANGVAVGDAARDEYETNWMRREKARQERRAKRERDTAEKDAAAEGDGRLEVSEGGLQPAPGAAVMPTEPRFVSEAYFMEFKFEPGNYYLAGRETLEGIEVLRIEYYPTRLFDDDDKKTPREIRQKDKKGRGEQIEEDIDRRMNKTALITLWVDPEEHQIVKYTFENVWLDFLPASWLVRVDELRASMTMGQPFAGVWLPRDIEISAGLTLANGSWEAAYARRFRNYREAQTSFKIRVPKEER